LKTPFLSSTITEMQSMLDHWEGGIRASGGALVKDKSYWYLIVWEWRDDAWHYKSIADSPGTLAISQDDGQKVVIDRLEVSVEK
jgi:hypothetical protein